MIWIELQLKFVVVAVAVVVARQVCSRSGNFFLRGRYRPISDAVQLMV